MSREALYAIGTLITWFGAFSLLRALVLGMRGRAGTPLLTALVAGGLGLVVGTFLTPKAGPAPLQIPLVWVVMPVAGWLATFAVLIGLGRAFQAMAALSAFERQGRLVASGIWLLLGGALGAWTASDPKTKFEIIKGGIPMDVPTFAGLAALAVAAVVAMVLSERATRTRGIAKGFATHFALISGSLVFGLPFAFLVITSFKEDRDMSSPAGIVWVPRVKETVPYLDPKQPIYAGTFQGQQVEGGVLETLPNGNLKIDIIRPAVMRGMTFDAPKAQLAPVARMIDVVQGQYQGQTIRGRAIEDFEDGRRRVLIDEPAALKGTEFVAAPTDVETVRNVGLRVQNYGEALDYLPAETQRGLVYLRNTLLLVILSVVGTLLSSSLVAYGFSRLRFPGRDFLFTILLSTMMLPAAVTLLPQFLIFRSLGWIDTLLPLWVPAFFASAFNVFLLRQFFMSIPMELEDAAKIDGCSYLKTFSSVMVPQIKPALAVIAIWTFMGAWNNFMGPLIYINSPENMTISYAVQLFQGDRGGEPGLLMAFATMAMLPVLALFVFAQKYFIEGVTLSGFGGR